MSVDPSRVTAERLNFNLHAIAGSREHSEKVGVAECSKSEDLP